MGKIIYVPQGRSAILDKAGFDVGYTSLFTDDISNCITVVCVTAELVYMVHIDQMTLLAKKNKSEVHGEIEKYMKESSSSTFIIYKEDSNLLKTDDFQKWLEEWRGKFKTKTFKTDNCSISIELASNGSSKPNIYDGKPRPAALCHHPMEQAFLAVQKIEHFVGLKSRIPKPDNRDTWKLRERDVCIFSSGKWRELPREESKIEAFDKLVQHELNTLRNANKTYLDIYNALNGIVERLKANKLYSSSDDDSLQMATFHLEGYLNSFEHSAIYIRNMKACLKKKPTLDRDACEFLKKTIHDEGDFSKLKSKIVDYKNNSKKSKAGEELCVEVLRYIEHYEKRKYYSDKQKAAEQEVTDRNATVADELQIAAPDAAKREREKGADSALPLAALTLQDVAQPQGSQVPVRPSISTESATSSDQVVKTSKTSLTLTKGSSD